MSRTKRLDQRISLGIWPTRSRTCLALFVGLCLLWGWGLAFAGVKEAKQVQERALKQFEKKKYLPAIRLHGRAMSLLPSEGAHEARAESLYYIGLCYQRLNLSQHSVGAWKRFLDEIAKVPGAEKHPQWNPRIQIARTYLKSSQPPSKQPKPDTDDPTLNLDEPNPPPKRTAPTPPPARPNNVEAPQHGAVAMVQPKPRNAMWLRHLRTCLRRRTRNLQDAVRRLQYCRDRMPRGTSCDRRCRNIKTKIDQKIQQLIETPPPNGDTGENNPPRGQDQPPPNSSPNPPSNDPPPHQTRRRLPPPSSGALRTAGTITLTLGSLSGALGVALWLYMLKTVEERDRLLNATPSASNTTEIVNKHNAAKGAEIATWLTISAGGAAIVLGLILMRIDKTITSNAYASRQKQSVPPVPTHAMTLLSTSGGQP